MKKFLFLVVMFSCIFNFLPSTASAVNLVINEGKIRLSIPPGSTKTGLIHIKNTSEETVAVRAYLDDWYYLPGGDGSKEFQTPGTLPLSCASWINFNPAEFTIPPYGNQVVNYIVKVPQGASGGHYAVLFFETLMAKPVPEEGIGVGVAVRLGSLFYVEAEGSLKREMTIGNLSLERASGSTPLKVNLELKNTGNVDITASGTFDLIDKTGMVYARGAFNDVYTFPNDTGTLSGEWNASIPAGNFDLVITLDLGKAQEEAEMGRGPVIVKEANIEIGASGKVLSVSALK